MSLRLSLLRQSVTMHQYTKNADIPATNRTSCSRRPVAMCEIVVREKLEGFHSSSKF
jgi:hypothetical protein